MHNQTIAEHAQRLRAREYSSVELTQHFLERIERHDDHLNSFITVTAEQALDAARAADAALAKGEAGPLTGIPLAHKDLFCTDGVRTSCGSRMLDQFIAPYDATVVARLKAAGMPMLGKTNMDEYAMGSSNETSSYGPAKNPWDMDYTPGGSSGGSAAAVALGLVPAATATDTGGSIRQPAAFCGVTGIKPTYGRVSRYGMIAYASSLDQGGVIAQTAEDCALVLEAMAGFDPKDSTSIDRPVEPYAQGLEQPIAGMRIGLPKQWWNESLPPEQAQLGEAALAILRELGCVIVEVDLPRLDLAIAAYYVIAMSEASSNLARLDGVRYGHRSENSDDLQALYAHSRAEGFGEEVKRRILIGTYALSAGYYDAYYLKAQQIRRLVRDDFVRAFEDVDLLFGPVAPSTAFKLGEKTDDPVSMYLADIYTTAVNLAGLPALTFPIGFCWKMPVGFQLIGSYWQEAKLLRCAHHYRDLG